MAFEYGGAEYDTLVVKGLPAGGSVVGSVGAGCEAMLVTADSKGKVAETNEQDNDVRRPADRLLLAGTRRRPAAQRNTPAAAGVLITSGP